MNYLASDHENLQQICFFLNYAISVSLFRKIELVSVENCPPVCSTWRNQRIRFEEDKLIFLQQIKTDGNQLPHIVLQLKNAKKQIWIAQISEVQKKIKNPFFEIKDDQIVLCFENRKNAEK